MARIGLVEKFKEMGYKSVRELGELYGISYMGMRRALEYNGIVADKTVRRGTKIFYLYDEEKTIERLAEKGYVTEQEQEV